MKACRAGLFTRKVYDSRFRTHTPQNCKKHAKKPKRHWKRRRDTGVHGYPCDTNEIPFVYPGGGHADNLQKWTRLLNCMTSSGRGGRRGVLLQVFNFRYQKNLQMTCMLGYPSSDQVAAEYWMGAPRGAAKPAQTTAHSKDSADSSHDESGMMRWNDERRRGPGVGRMPPALQASESIDRWRGEVDGRPGLAGNIHWRACLPRQNA